MWLYLAAAVAVGTILPLQAGINATLRERLPHPMHAALISFAVGTVLLLAGVWATRAGWTLRSSRPWWIWTGGLIGAVYVFASVVLSRRLGAGILVAATVAGQLISGLVLDHFGVAGFHVRPITPARLAGVALIVAGVALVRLGR